MGLGPACPEDEMSDATTEQTYFGCLQAGPDDFVHFHPPLGVLPGEQIHEAHARQPWVAVAVLREPLVPVGPVAPPADFEAGLTRDMLRKLAPLVWMHVAQYGFAPIPWSASAWRGVRPDVAPCAAGA